jgi:hypothetical protein
MTVQDDPRARLQIPTGDWQLFLGWVLFVLGILVTFGSGAAGGVMVAIGSSFLAWGTGACWLHHIEAKQILIMERQTQIHAAVLAGLPPPLVDAPPVS